MFGDAVSMTYILDEDSASVQCPLGEKEKSNASPPGNAAEELVVVETRFTVVLLGCRYASNKFLFTSWANFLFSRCRLSSVKGAPSAVRLFRA